DAVAGEQVGDLVGRFGSVGGLQLPHDGAGVNLHRAFAHVQFIGDDLVWFTFPDGFGHLDLPGGEQLHQAPVVREFGIDHLAYRDDGTRRHEDPAGKREVYGFDTNLDTHRRGYVAPRATP